MIKIDSYSHDSKQGEVILKQFLHFSKCIDYNELVNLSTDMLGIIFTDWIKMLDEGLKQTFNTVQRKIWFVQTFLVSNEISLRFLQDSKWENYN